MNKALSALLALTVLFASTPVRADYFPNVPGGGVQEKIDTIAPSAFPTYPMKSGQWNLRVVPTYITVDHDETSACSSATGQCHSFLHEAGGGGAIGLTYGFSNHFGLSLIGAGVSATGTGLITDSQAPDSHFGDVKLSGGMGTAALIFDPVSGSEGFRLPLMVGAGYVSLTEESTQSGLTGTIPAQSSVDHTEKLEGPVAMIGVSAQFDTGPFRWVPFALLIKPMKDETVGCTATGNASCGTTVIFKKDLGRAGLEVTYRPWNLGFTYSPPSQGVSLYSMRWQRAWGGK